MNEQLVLELLREVGPRWATVFLVGLWFWRCTPWFGRQLEKLIDGYLARKQ